MPFYTMYAQIIYFGKYSKTGVISENDKIAYDINEADTF